MTHSPDERTPDPADESLRLPSFINNDETLLSPGSATMTSLPALGLPGYEFIREIHRGGQGVVYLALQKSTHRKVAIKVMKEGPFASPADKARFDREVRILARLKHPNIVAIHDSGTAAGCDYFVMDYVEGAPLGDYLAMRKRSIAELVELFRRTCEAVQAAHAHGVVHRDLKPSNIRIDAEGAPHILDFGLAKMSGSALEASRMTETGFFVGSVPWASPEQAEGRVTGIDSRTDVYSLGVILYSMLVGRLPIDVDGSVPEVLDRIVHATPPRPRAFRSEIDADLETIILKCLHKDPARRYASAGELADDLARHQSGMPISARRDSVAYLLRKSAVRSIRSRPLISKLLLASIATAAAYFFVEALVFEKSSIDWAFRRFAMRWASPRLVAAGHEFDHVRVVAMNDPKDLAAIASSEGLKGIDPSRNPTLRRLHGRMMERLVPAGPRVVVFDIAFRQPTEFDDDFVRGVQALRKAGIDVVVSTPSWFRDAGGLPELSPTIAPHVTWGCWKVDASEKSPWSIELLMYRRGLVPQCSLALAATVAFNYPGLQLELGLNENERLVYLSYWTPHPIVPQARSYQKMYDVVPLSALWIVKDETPDKKELQVGDTIAQYVISVPSEPVLAAATIDYRDVFSAPLEQLKSWFANRAVIIADQRGKTDRHPHPDGRDIPGCYAHAIAIDSLLDRTSIQRPGNTVSRTLTIIGGLVGALLVAAVGRSVRRLFVLACVTVAAMVLITAAAFAISLTFLRTHGYLCNPFVPLAAAWLAAMLAVGVEIVRGNTRPADISRSAP